MIPETIDSLLAETGADAGCADGACERLARELNRECLCVSLDADAWRRELEASEAGAELARMIREDRPNLCSGSAVFVGSRDLARMARIVAAVERVVALPAWRERVLAYSGETASRRPGARGVFLGYDFHLGVNGPQLIEINTNAGGAMVNALLGRAQRACCERLAAMLPGSLAGQPVESVFLDMFREEWRLERGDAPLGRVAIVDEAPRDQYLYPEFVLFRSLFERHGIEAEILDPRSLACAGGRLMHAGRPVDLVYNRLTDFGFDEPHTAALRQAWLENSAVITPHPHAHALYADKRNLVALTDAGWLARIGVDAATRQTLAGGIPLTLRVAEADADELWENRRALFFKPAAGFGSRAAYRGDKLTRRVFEAILQGEYVAQRIVAPTRRRVGVAGAPVDLKLDLRNYVYAGEVQLVAARLYEGQTTNFRTPGGGFAPVLTVSCSGA
ncbi:MAG: hypothetical protein Fur0039_26010 [Rhodocyclaceae bacterium]